MKRFLRTVRIASVASIPFLIIKYANTHVALREIPNTQ